MRIIPKLGYVISDLCEDVILGQDFMNLHKEVVIYFGGNRPTLSICGLAVATVQAPTLFSNLLPNCKPIATRSRNFSKQDRHFISQEIDRLLNDGIIEKAPVCGEHR